MTNLELLQKVAAVGGDVVVSLSDDNWLAGVEFTPLLVAHMLEVAYANGLKNQATLMAGETRSMERGQGYQLDTLLRVYGGQAE